MKLSILIPARNEEWLGETIKDILRNIEDETEIITVLDGYTDPVPEIPNDDRVTVITLPKSVGQRAATNIAAHASTAKYVAKVDAHCSFDKGFDRKLLEKMNDNWTVVPVMRNLHAFDLVCSECGKRKYQGPMEKCCGKDMVKVVTWIGKSNPQSTSYRMNPDLEFKYWGEYKSQQVGDVVDTFSLQGSFFMMTREKYWELDICDEEWGSWGGQGAEVALKTWLSGGEVKCIKTTWYAHMFRTQPGFSFPYPNPAREQKKAKNTLREVFLHDRWEKAIHPLSWLIEKFNPPEWNVSKGILYYTDNELDETLMKKVQTQIKENSLNKPIVSVSLKPIDFGDNIVMDLERGKLTMHKQILAGLKKLKTDVVFFCEHDVFYHPSHFEFTPGKKDVFYYNQNLWRVRQGDGFSVKYDHKSLSQMCAYRETLIKEYEHRVNMIEKKGFGRTGTCGYEPGTRSIRRKGFSDSKSEFFNSDKPNIDIRHDNNLSRSKWKPEEFRSHRSCRNWQEKHCEDIVGWDNLSEVIKNG